MTGAMPGAIICYLYDCVCCLSLRAVYLYIAFVSVVGISDVSFCCASVHRVCVQFVVGVPRYCVVARCLSFAYLLRMLCVCAAYTVSGSLYLFLNPVIISFLWV